MATHSYDNSTDLNVLTRDYCADTIIKQLFLRSPMVTRLLLDKRMVQKGGIKKTVTVKKSQPTSHVQAYGPNEALTSAVVNTKSHVRFGLYRFQVPIRWTIEEVEQNVNADNSARIADLVAERIDDCWDAAKDKLQEWIYDPDTTEAASNKKLLSLATALTADRTYGGLSRATTATNEWWQGRSPAGSYTDQATAAAPDIPNFRKWRDIVERYNETSAGNLVVIAGDAQYRKWLAAAESRNVNTKTPGGVAKYGHTSCMIDGVEFIKDKYLGADGTREKYMFLLDTSTWNYEIDKDRNYKLTQPFEQHKIDGGADYVIQRIMTSHRFYCDKCTGNMYLSNVS